MKKYIYSAMVRDQEIKCHNIDELTKIINDIFDFNVVSRASLYNYFTRPERMKSKIDCISKLQLRRQNLGAI
eukprot:SAG11_NODE_16950_length_532_cov_116.944573_2_plen_72_part_00